MVVDLRETLSGSVGAFCCVYAGLPFEVVKVRLQTQGTSHVYNGVLHGLRRIAAEESVLALWKGAIPALSSAIIENSVLFTVNGAVKRFYIALYATTHHQRNDPSRPLSTLDEALMGSIAGVFSATAITPAEVVKCRLQFQRGKLGVGEYHDPFDCAKQIWRKEGLRGLFSGYSATLLRDVPFNFFFFGAYQAYTSLLVKALHKETKKELHPLWILFAGGIAGATGWSVVFPADVIKSHLQTIHGHGRITFRDAAKLVYRQNGFAGFYKGWGAAVLRSFPANGSLFLGVEMTHRIFHFFEK